MTMSISVRTSAMVVVALAGMLFAILTRQPGAPSDVSAAAANVSSESLSPDEADRETTTVLVELFTSEGCSSCPPADALLSRLGRTQPVHGADIIALEEHVDYWDRLGWKDPYSSEAATARQNDFAEALGGHQVYTPQMVVDGQEELVGSSEGDALRAIHAASQVSKPFVHLSWGKADLLEIHIDPLTNATHGDEAAAYLILAENRLHSDVKRGENAGRALEHDGVTRQFIPLGKIDLLSSGFSSTTVVLPAREWIRANLRAVVFVQGRRSHRVLAVAAIPVSVN